MGSLPGRLSGLSRRQRVGSAGVAVVAGAGGLLAAWIAFRVWLAGVRRGLRVLRWSMLVATLRLYRPCPDCHKYIHADARLCHRCGYRRRA
jgi:hypothetical protein